MPAYDVVIVGARAAGAATALLLARAGHRVAVVDRARYGSDTLSTHALMRPGVLQLERWGLLDRVRAAGTPPVHRVSFDYGGAPIVIDVEQPLFAPRRTVLDRILVDAARDAGADMAFGVSVEGLATDSTGRATGIVARGADGRPLHIDGTVTVGADGLRSTVARAVDAPHTATATAATASIYAYWSGVPATGYEWYFGLRSAAGAIPTNGGLVCVFVSGTAERFEREMRRDRGAAVDAILREVAPDLAERLAGGRRVGPLRGFPGRRGWLRRPFGAGWALVGDAGYFKDPLTAHGITDALRDADLLARALHAGLTGDAPMDVALAGYERLRDDWSRSLFATTDAIASFDWRLSDLQRLHHDLSRDMQAEARHLEELGPFPVRTPASLGA